MCVGPACRSAHRVRSLELQPERAAGGPSAAADQQPDPEPAEPGADAAEHGAEPPAPRLLLPRPDRDGAPQYQPADGPRPGDRLSGGFHGPGVRAAISEALRRARDGGPTNRRAAVGERGCGNGAILEG